MVKRPQIEILLETPKMIGLALIGGPSFSYEFVTSPLLLTVCHFTVETQKLCLYTFAETHVIYVSCDTYEENKMPQLLKQSNYPWLRTLLLSSL
jgi:hypothetical protein